MSNPILRSKCKWPCFPDKPYNFTNLWPLSQTLPQSSVKNTVLRTATPYKL